MGVINRAAIKQEAKTFIGTDKKWFSMFLAIALYEILSGGISFYISFFNNLDKTVNAGSFKYFFDFYQSGDTQANSVTSSFDNLLTLLLLPFAVAVAGYFLNHLRGFNPEWKSLYQEGINNYGKYFVIEFVIRLTVGLWTILFIVPGVIKYYEYSMAQYIIHDNKNLSLADVKKMSRLMTQGYKSEIFMLDLSFIGLFILSILSFGLGFIYVLPYYYTTKAMYYENLKTNAIENGIIAQEAFMPERDIFQDYSNYNQYQDPYQNQYQQPQNYTTNNIYSSQIVDNQPQSNEPSVQPTEDNTIFNGEDNNENNF